MTSHDVFTPELVAPLHAAYRLYLAAGDPLFSALDLTVLQTTRRFAAELCASAFPELYIHDKMWTSFYNIADALDAEQEQDGPPTHDDSSSSMDNYDPYHEQLEYTEHLPLDFADIPY